MNADEPTMPETLDEAEARRKELTLDVQSIQAQLGDKQRTDDDGRRLTSKEYWAWKKRASHALNQKLDELRAVKAWIRSNRQPNWPEGEASHDQSVLDHLSALHSILASLTGGGLELGDEQHKSFEAASQYLSSLEEPPRSTP